MTDDLPGENAVAERLRRVVKHLVRNDRAAAFSELEPLIGVTILTDPIVTRPVCGDGTWTPGTGVLTKSPPRSTIAAVYVRDSFTCRYCDRWTIPNPVLRLISTAFPAEFPFHPNWRKDIAPRVYWDISTTIDHIHAVATGGDYQDPVNLATACARCQYQKNSRTLESLGWELLGPAASGTWSGVIDDYPPLYDALGQPQPAHHRTWLRAFAAATAARSQPSACDQLSPNSVAAASSR